MKQKNTIHFEISERKVLLRIIDILMAFFGIFLLSTYFGFEYLSISSTNTVPLIVLAVYISIFGTIFEIYDLQQASKLDVSFKNIVLCMSTVVLFYLLTPIITPFLPEARLQIVYFYVTLIIFVFLWRVLYNTLIASPRFFKHVLFISEVSNIDNVVSTLKDADVNYQFIGFINSIDDTKDRIKYNGLKEFGTKDLSNIIIEEQISEIIVATSNAEHISTDLYHELMLLLERGFKIREYTQVYEEVTKKVPIQYVGKDFYKYFPFSRNNENQLYRFFQRTFDVLFSFFGLLFLVLIIPFVALGNVFGNKGPLFYTQERIGKNSTLFTIFKFRTMVVNAEAEKAQWATKDDVRVTTFGKFLRRSRLDEIPQFINVLKGQMSIIGPRPERPFFVAELSRSIPFYETRHIIKPGLTGWAQVNSRYGGSVEESLTKLQYDLYYIKHRSPFLDLNIILKTLSTVMYYRGQ
ncbi:exopolysaccharide biosynthesis polyprenyl glycosylphosphotransferase [uncultured Winogradskyella sp.]|jgi:exopolysaccharide biosynthesis polyprenyl glycosylphosphotransferase|uniref:exopolysaccharide biosynthesis polyprenyl glycosylphosphotransferase n=1 Tax=uncultured Winogradskyella sp. TaxID=395353 RepID=UPI0025F6F405|nr:exopolysaccharide biosynthesis polyprenyl glycosylphosphotransferase [uncultured Winogradskyella sp.]